MKKILILMAVLGCSTSALAQFTIYEPVTSQRSTSSNTVTYAPFTIFEPVDDPVYDTPQPRVQKPKPQYVTTKGYYYNREKWQVVPIRVMIQGDEIRLASVKNGSYWVPCNATVTAVNGFDPEVARDNFNYKAFYNMLGTLYF